MRPNPILPFLPSLRLAAVAVVAVLALATFACAPDGPPAADGTADGTALGTADGDASVFTAEAEAVAARTFDASLLRGPIRFLSDDLLAGRGPSTQGDALTQLYLSTEMESLGLTPAFDGDWLQPFDIVGVTSTVPDTWSFQGGGTSVTLDDWDDFIAASGVQEPTASLDGAELVFVGYGIEAPEHDWNDYKDMDVTGKVLVMLNNDPDWAPDLFEGTTRLYYGRWTYKYEVAAEKGAAGAIIIHTTPSAGYPWQVVQTSWTGEQFQLPAVEGDTNAQVEAWVTEDAARRLMEAAGQDLDQLVEAARSRDFEPVPLGLTTSLELTNEVTRKSSANVGGVLPGRDPELADEFVVFTAHHDHLGVGRPNDEGDSIYNGALDNALGSSQLLALARAYQHLPEDQRPRRSMLFLFVGAEESGLLGSQFYAQNPSVPAGLLAANINYDGGNIWGESEELVLVGYGKSSLDEVARTVAERQGRTVSPDQFPDRGFYYRSDQFSLAKIGVPALYFDTGTRFTGRDEHWGREQIEAWEAVHYHQPSDELEDSWVFDGALQDTRMGFWTGLLIANADEMPSWNPGDEFEAARQEALAALDQAP